DTALDDYASSWRAMRLDACLATAVRREQSEPVRDLRMQCLDRRSAELDAPATLLATEHHRAVLDRALQAAVAPPPVPVCGEVSSLVEAVPPPPGADVAIAQLRARLDTETARIRAGLYPGSADRLAAILAEARRIGYARLEAEVLVTLGELQLALAKLDDAL